MIELSLPEELTIREIGCGGPITLRDAPLTDRAFPLVIDRSRWIRNHLVNSDLTGSCAIGWLGRELGGFALLQRRHGMQWPRHMGSIGTWRHWTKEETEARLMSEDILRGYGRTTYLIIWINDAMPSELEEAIPDLLDDPLEATEAYLNAVREAVLVRLFTHLDVKLTFEGVSKAGPSSP